MTEKGDTNPYHASAEFQETTDPVEPVQKPPLTFRQRAGRLTVSTVVIIAFTGLGYAAIRLFLARYWLMSGVTMSVSLMCIPLADHSTSVRERIIVSLIMPFAVAGLAGFVVLYFQMFHFAWFESIFNDKGSGPFGLIVSAISGLAAGGFAGWWILGRFVTPDDSDTPVV